jgi:hypothetical protein
MDKIWPVILGAMFANLLTIIFIYGLWRARKIMEGDNIDLTTFNALAVPMFFLGVGMYLYLF